MKQRQMSSISQDNFDGNFVITDVLMPYLLLITSQLKIDRHLENNWENLNFGKYTNGWDQDFSMKYKIDGVSQWFFLALYTYVYSENYNNMRKVLSQMD